MIFFNSIVSLSRFRWNSIAGLLIAQSVFTHASPWNIGTLSGIATLGYLNADILASFLQPMLTRYQVIKKNRVLSVLVSLLLLGLATSSIYFAWMDPAHAAFLSGAEAWLKSALQVSDKSAISLVFNMLRGILVLFIVISLIMVIQKAQQGDDWQTLARIPLLVVVVIFAGDALVGMVIGDSGSSGSGDSSTTNP